MNVNPGSFIAARVPSDTAVDAAIADLRTAADDGDLNAASAAAEDLLAALGR